MEVTYYTHWIQMPVRRGGEKQCDREELNPIMPRSVILTSVPDGSADDYRVAAGAGPG